MRFGQVKVVEGRFHAKLNVAQFLLDCPEVQRGLCWYRGEDSDDAVVPEATANCLLFEKLNSRRMVREPSVMNSIFMQLGIPAFSARSSVLHLGLFLK